MKTAVSDPHKVCKYNQFLPLMVKVVEVDEKTHDPYSGPPSVLRWLWWNSTSIMILVNVGGPRYSYFCHCYESSLIGTFVSAKATDTSQLNLFYWVVIFTFATEKLPKRLGYAKNLCLCLVFLWNLLSSFRYMRRTELRATRSVSRLPAVERPPYRLLAMDKMGTIFT